MYTGLRQFPATEDPLKMTKKALFLLKIFSVFVFGHVRKRLDKKWRLISKFMTS